MQALYCRKCSTVRTFKSDKSLTSCDCGVVWGWHETPLIVKLYTHDPSDRTSAKVIEMNNRYLNQVSKIEHAAMYADPQIDTLHRNAHQQATIAPLFSFDISRRACWATMSEVGTTRYSFFATTAEAESKARSEGKSLADFAPSDTKIPVAV